MRRVDYSYLRKLALLCLCLSLMGCKASADLLKGFGQDSSIVENETEYECLPSPPSPSPPAQHAGAEGAPPLPLPVVPLRRTEKKNPPRPPVLISRIVPSEQRQWPEEYGNVDNLLRWLAENMDLHFSSTRFGENEIPVDNSEIPALYRTGMESISWSEDQRRRLRDYVKQGGTLVLEARCGRWDFFASALEELRTMFPENPPYRLNFDHPLYHSYYDLDPEDIQYRDHAREAGARNSMPSAIGIDVGCRTGVFLFRWDVSSGWDGLDEERAPHCLGYTVETSRVLGANLMAYITAEHQTAPSLGQSMRFVDASSVRSRTDKFTVAQVRYPGLWKTHEAAIPRLLDAFHRRTDIPVSFDSREVDIESGRLFEYPLIYMTGHHDFVISESGRANLRRYLRRGGILFAESCCGREGFDQGFRNLIRQTFPEAELSRLPQGHPIFRFPAQIEEISPRPALARRLRTQDQIEARLYGLYIDGRLAVIYSPYDLSTGWEGGQSPYCAGVAPEDAMNLGVNIFFHSLLQ